MEKGKYDKAFQSVCRLRKSKVQAARDMYYAYKLLEVEAEQREGRNIFKEFFTVRRNRRAAQSSFFVMFMQQFCGVNVIVSLFTPTTINPQTDLIARHITAPKYSWTPVSTAHKPFSSPSVPEQSIGSSQSRQYTQ